MDNFIIFFKQLKTYLNLKKEIKKIDKKDDEEDEKDESEDKKEVKEQTPGKKRYYRKSAK